MKNHILLLLLMTAAFQLRAQSKLDSLQKIIKTQADNTEKADNLNYISSKYAFISADSGAMYAKIAIAISTQLQYTKGLADGHFYLSNNWAQSGVMDSALISIDKARELYTSLNDTHSLIDCHISLGVIYGRSGNIELALENLYMALEYNEKIADSLGIARTCTNIGMSYFTIGDFEKAEEYFMRALLMSTSLDSKRGIAHSYNNLGMVYGQKGDMINAKAYFLKNLELSRQIENYSDMVSSYINLGHVARTLKQFDEAKEYYRNSFDVCKRTNSFPQLVSSYQGLALVYEDIGELNEAEKNYFTAIQISKQYHLDAMLMETFKLLADMYHDAGLSDEAYNYLNKFYEAKDSIFSSHSSERIEDLEKKYETSQKEQKIKLLNQEKKLSNLELKRRSIVNFSLGGFAILILIFSYIIYNRLKIMRAQKTIIEEQNEELNQINEELATQRDEIERQKQHVELINKEVKDSITYAERIQKAILPSSSIIRKLLPHSFILYQPKDIVAGDFYWLDQSGDTTLFAVADCTGHGVPGAMMSVVCHNALNRSVKEFKLTDPGKILDKTREIVVAEFEKSDMQVNDGMDIALCNIKGNQLLYAGAHNPLWIVRNNTLMEINADRQPIGKFEDAMPFTTHAIDLQQADAIYLFSDGYVDQFGGEKDRKFGRKRLKEQLLSIQHIPMQDQRQPLHDNLTSWVNKGNSEQIDDICVLGVQIN